MEPSIRITAKQIRFLLNSARPWAILRLHVEGGVPADLRGNYAVPPDEQRQHKWGLLDEATELGVLRLWQRLGYKLPVAEPGAAADRGNGIDLPGR